MKNIVVILLLSAVVLSCEKKTQDRPNRAYVNGVTSLARSESAADLAKLNWIVKHLWEATAVNPIGGGEKIGFDFNYNPVGDPFYQRDTINGRFLFWDTFVISKDGKEPGVLLKDSRDIVYTVYRDSGGCIQGMWSDTDEQFCKNFYNPSITRNEDTVAYTPNSVLQKIRAEVVEALAQGDYDRCRRVFDQGVVFIPITGAEYRELERQGLN